MKGISANANTSTNSSLSLYVSDLDGTLLDLPAAISPKARSLIIDALEKQRKLITIASARSVTTISEILGDLPFSLPVIQLNGALITDYHNREDFHQVFIPEMRMHKLISILQEIGACFLASVKEYHHDVNRCLIPNKRNAAMDAFYQERIAKKDSRIALIKTGDYVHDYRLISVTVIEPHERSKKFLAIVQEEFKDQLEIYPMGVDHLGWEWTTIQDILATKGNAVAKIAEMYNINPRQVTVFGDNLNDLSMFQKDFRGVAVANAHPLIKEHAQEVISHHQEISVAQYLHTN